MILIGFLLGLLVVALVVLVLALITALAQGWTVAIVGIMIGIWYSQKHLQPSNR